MSINKVIEYSLEVILTLLVLTWALGMFFKLGPFQKQSSNNTDTISQSITNASYNTNYNKELSGSDAVTAINTIASKDITIEVITLDGSDIKYIYATYDMSNISLPGYIKLSNNFKSTIQYTDNKTIKQITFKEHRP